MPLRREKPPTNPNNCNDKYEDFFKPKTVACWGFRNQQHPETGKLQNFMKLGILDIASADWEASPRRDRIGE